MNRIDLLKIVLGGKGRDFFRNLSQQQSEIDEQSRGKTPKYQKIMIVEGEVVLGDLAKHKNLPATSKEHVGWVFGGEYAVIFATEDEVKKFMQEKPQAVEKLKQDFGGKLLWENGKLTAHQPRRRPDFESGKGVYKSLPGSQDDTTRTIDTGYRGSEESLSERERILRYGLYPKLREVIFSDDSFNNELEKKSIPPVEVNERRHFDAYNKVSNEEIIFRTHNIESYGSANNFLKTVIARLKGKKVDPDKQYPLARQFNTKYRNWALNKKNQKDHEGLTDIYQLRKRGFEEENLDVTVASFFTLRGVLQGNTYMWGIRFKVLHGRYIHDDMERTGNLNPDREITVRKNVDLSGNDREFNENYTVMDYPPILQGLEELLNDFKQEIMNIDPKDIINRALFKQYDIEKQ